MRYLLVATAFVLLLTLVPTDALAAGPSQGVQIVNNNYVSNNNYNVGPSAHRGGGYDYGHRSYRSYGSRSRGFESHNEAVARIKATHSRFRKSYHPRSFYNSPPHYYDWRGW
jgi:hypothetical protein